MDTDCCRSNENLSGRACADCILSVLIRVLRGSKYDYQAWLSTTLEALQNLNSKNRMKKVMTIVFVLVAATAFSQTTDLRSVLLEQLKTTHNKKDWFVPVSVALEGLTPEQAMWKDNSGNHSVGQLAYHLLFWNQRQVSKFKGEKESAFSGNNEETFNSFDKASWAQTVSKLNDVMVELEKLVQSADENKLKTWAPTIANISTHNAYHTGQIIFVRKLQGAWDPEKGVK
jgi:uncharacterized damage-inducible protein DinB